MSSPEFIDAEIVTPQQANGPPPVGIPNSPIKVVWSAFLIGFFSLALLGCGGIINPRWIGWCLIAAGVLGVVLAIANLWKAIDATPVLVLSGEGLFDQSEKPGVLTPWHELHGVTLWTLRVNGIPSTRRLILNLGGAGPDAKTRSISLDDLKGSPKEIADMVLAWANWARQTAGAAPLQLGEGAGDESK